MAVDKTKKYGYLILAFILGWILLKLLGVLP